MIDPLSLSVGAGIAGGFFLAGHVSGRVAAARRRPAPPPEVKPICGCRHHRAQHDPDDSRCHAIINIAPHGYTAKLQQCTCRQYVGPEPITSVWVPPVLTEGSG